MRHFRWSYWIGLLFMATFIVVSTSLASARVMGPPDGSGGGGSGGSGQEKNCPPPPIRRPEYQNDCYYIVHSQTYETDRWLPTDDWRWGYRTDAGMMGGITKVTIDWAPGYPKHVDELSHTNVLDYIYDGTREGQYYIEDQYKDWLRYWYDLVRLERGRVTFNGLCWVRIWEMETWRMDVWNDGVVERYRVEGRRSSRDGPGESNPDSICNLNPYSSIDVNLWDWIEFTEDSKPFKAPPIDRPIPPSGIVPPPVFSGYEAYLGGREILKDDYKSRDDWGRGGVWLFGGRPSRNMFSATRGTNAILAIDTLAQGDLSVPPALNKVAQVIIRIPDIPGAQAKATLVSGNAQKGQWLTSLPIPPTTRVGKYKVVFEIRGTNYWGQARTKIVEGQIWIDGGDCPATDRNCQKEHGMLNPGEVSFCGLSEDEMRALGDRWIYKCNDPRLVK